MGARVELEAGRAPDDDALPTSASTPEPFLFKLDTCLRTLVKTRESPSQAESLNWLTAVGGSVEVEGKRVKMTPGIRKAQRLDISPTFVFRYPRIYESLRSAMRAYGGKWTARDGVVRIAGKIDLTARLAESAERRRALMLRRSLPVRRRVMLRRSLE